METQEHVYYHAWNLATLTNAGLLGKIKKYYGSWEKAWIKTSDAALTRLSPKSQLAARKREISPAGTWEHFKKSSPNIQVILNEDASFPPLLREIHKAPQGIYVRGNYDAALAKTHTFLSVVGTRRPSVYGIIQTQKIIQYGAGYPIVIVSGLAHGIDTIAHETALLEKLPTWAVIGHGHLGLGSHQRDLIRMIEENGCTISEYPPECPAESFRFPERNRIIAGLSPLTLVTEAPIRSGANITAISARDENREVFALCADIDRIDCAGNLSLIEQHIATPLTSYHALVEALGLDGAQARQMQMDAHERSPQRFQDAAMNAIVDCMSYKSFTSVSEMMQAASISDITIILQKISLLELKGCIEKIGGNFRLKMSPMAKR